MAVNNTGFPVTYQPNYYQQTGYGYGQQQNQMPQIATQQQTQPQYNDENNFRWVQGESAAKSFYVQPGKSVMLMDSEADIFYIKSTDLSGIPLPLRIFKYEEITNKTSEDNMVDTSQFVTWEQLEKKLKELTDRPRNQKPNRQERKGESNE